MHSKLEISTSMPPYRKDEIALLVLKGSEIPVKVCSCFKISSASGMEGYLVTVKVSDYYLKGVNIIPKSLDDKITVDENELRKWNRSERELFVAKLAFE